MQLIEAFVRNPVKVSVGVLLVALFGFIALFQLPKQLTPEVEIPKISIETRWPGASPEEVEREIVQEQEEQLQSVEGVTKLSAECSNSVGSITLEFSVGTNLSEALLKVNSRLQQVPEYPEDADEPVISTSDPRANAIAYFILRPRVPSPEEVAVFQAEARDLADKLEPAAHSADAAAATAAVLELVDRQPEFIRHVDSLLEPAPGRQITAAAWQAAEANPDPRHPSELATELERIRDLPEPAERVAALLSARQRFPDAREALGRLVFLDSPRRIAPFQDLSREAADLLERVRRAHNPGLGALRIRALLEEHPEIKARIRAMLPPDIRVTEKRLFAEDFIEAAFERVPGVSNANVFGGREEEMQVIVDPQKLAARGVTIMDVRRVLREENRDISGGDLWEGKRTYVIRTLGRFRKPEDVADVILTQGPGGEPVYVRDVAEVRQGFKKPGGVVKNFGTVCVVVNCIRETGANVLDTMAGLKKVVDDLNRDLLRQNGLQLVQVYDETEYIYDAIDLVVNNIIVGGLLTIAVLLMFLRSGRSTLVIALAIPTSIIGTFLLLNLMGRSLNVISLAGLAFAVGMLVDNAVVVLENCYRHAEMGDNAFTASVRGAKEVWGAVVASTLTTLAVFLPVLFVQEEAGQLFRDIALAISSAVGLSLIVSITVVPTAAARLLRAGRRSATDAEGPVLGDGRGQPRVPARRGRRGRLRRAIGAPLAAFPRLLDAFGRGFVQSVVGINRFLQRSILLRVATVVGFAWAAVMFSWLVMPKVEYLPEGNRNLVFGILLPPPGYNIDRGLQIGKELEDATQPYWDVDLDDPAIEKLPFPAIDDYFFVARGRQVFLGLRAVDPAKAGQLVPLVRGVAAQMPGTIPAVSQRSLFSREIATGRTVDIEITGPDLEKLVELGRRVFLQVPGAVPGGMAFPRPSLDLSSPEVHVLRRTKQATDLAMSTDEIGYTIDALTDGAYATDFYVGGDKIDLTIIGNQKYAERTQDIEDLPVATPTGQLVPLEALADVELAGGPEQVNRRERQRAITVQVTPPDDMPLEEAIDRINGQIVAPLRDQGVIGGAYRITLAGTADKLLATWKALRFNFLLALLITYLLMAALFESWLYPLVIIFSVPFGAVGGLLGLWLLNGYLKLYPYAKMQSLDVLTMLGFVILIGTVVNNAILIVHQSLNHMRDEGMEPGDAILESVRTRIRPIFMTTTTTVLGLCPLVLFPGQGSELYRGLGAVVLGGLIVSTAFTLILVPTLFSLLMQTKAALVRLLRIGGGQVPASADASEPVGAAVPR